MNAVTYIRINGLFHLHGNKAKLHVFSHFLLLLHTRIHCRNLIFMGFVTLLIKLAWNYPRGGGGGILYFFPHT